MGFSGFKKEVKKTKENIKYLFKETIKLFYGNKTHAAVFWSSILGILLIHVFVSSSSASLLKVLLLAFFALNTTRIARGLEDILENITIKDVEILSFVIVVTEISLGFLMSARYFNGVVADVLSILILSLIFSQYLRYLNNVEYKEYEKELKLDAINNPKDPIIEPLIQSIIEKRERNPHNTKSILENSKKIIEKKENLEPIQIKENNNAFLQQEEISYSLVDNKPKADLVAAAEAIENQKKEVERERERINKTADIAAHVLSMEIEFENIVPQMIDFEEQANLEDIETSITKEDLILDEEDDLDDDFDDILSEIDMSDDEDEVEELIEIENIETEEIEEIEEIDAITENENSELETEITPKLNGEINKDINKEPDLELELDESVNEPSVDTEDSGNIKDEEIIDVSKNDVETLNDDLDKDINEENNEEDFELDEDKKEDFELDEDKTEESTKEDFKLDEDTPEESPEEDLELDEAQADTPVTEEKPIEDVDAGFDSLELELSEDADLEISTSKLEEKQEKKDELLNLDLELNEDNINLDFELNEDKEDVTENNEAQVNLALDLNEDKKESASEPEHISLKDEDLQLNLGDEIEFDLDDIDLEFKIEKEETDEVDERFNILDSDIDLSFEDESK